MRPNKSWMMALSIIWAALGYGTAQASSVTISLDNAAAAISPAGFGENYSGSLTVTIGTGTSLIIGNGAAARSFGVLTPPGGLTVDDSIGSLSFNNGNLLAGSLAFAVTNGASTDQIQLNFAAKLNAISSAGAAYSFSAQVLSVTMPDSFGGLDLSNFDVSALKNSNMAFVVANTPSTADALVTLHSAGSLGNPASGSPRFPGRVPLRLSDGGESSFSLTPGRLIPASVVEQVPLPAAASAGLGLLGMLGVARTFRRSKDRR